MYVHSSQSAFHAHLQFYELAIKLAIHLYIPFDYMLSALNISCHLCSFLLFFSLSFFFDCIKYISSA